MSSWRGSLIDIFSFGKYYSCSVIILLDTANVKSDFEGNLKFAAYG